MLLWRRSILSNPRFWFTLALTLVLVVPALANATLGGGWLWELANGLGFAALVCLVLLSIDTGRGGAAVARHERLAWLALLLIAAHGGLLLVPDSTLVEYLKLSAPPYMLAGLAALALLGLLTLSARPRLRQLMWHRHLAFRWVHWVIAMAAFGLTLWHLLGSAFYLGTLWQQVLFAAGLIAVVLALRWLPALRGLPLSLPWLTGLGVAGVLLFTLLRNV